MNIETEHGVINKYEGFFEKKIDALGNKYPTIKDRKKTWEGKFLFAKKLMKLQQTLNKRREFTIINETCGLCEKTDIGNKQYNLKNVNWKENILHYILQHNYKPTFDFMEFILGHYVGVLSNNNIRLPTLTYQLRSSSQKYVKIDKNQLQILDALMNNGGWVKKYEDEKNKTMKYSEHSGVMLFNNNLLDKIIVSSKSTEESKKDDEIFLPSNMLEAYECEYIFHTHPPTPFPGGRVDNGVLFEMPSAQDIAHFLEHSFIGITRGSLVIAPEGLYNITNIRKKKYIFKDEKQKKEFLDNITKIQMNTQNEYIKKYTGENFYELTNKPSFLSDINKFLKKYNVKIEYFPRKKNSQGLWILDDIYLPV